ncbi:hypothetical protein PR048_002337 [Dryococelus australis]|uniref:Uncharacterized protein n=1 Tax=Dryococelus australis TaxID=614101 RepID=A0ABQ9IKZ0_9NEOP|nr:hypothetical protein PR048_002337 [Dryococelus australis]
MSGCTEEGDYWEVSLNSPPPSTSPEGVRENGDVITGSCQSSLPPGVRHNAKTQGGSLRKPADKRLDTHARKSESDPAGKRTRFALVVGEHSNRCVTAAPRIVGRPSFLKPRGSTRKHTDDARIERKTLIAKKEKKYRGVAVHREHGCWFYGRGGTAARQPASLLVEPGPIPGGVAPGFPRVGIVPDDATGRRVFFSSISSFTHPFTVAHSRAGHWGTCNPQRNMAENLIASPARIIPKLCTPLMEFNAPARRRPKVYPPEISAHASRPGPPPRPRLCAAPTGLGGLGNSIYNVHDVLRVLYVPRPKCVFFSYIDIMGTRLIGIEEKERRDTASVSSDQVGWARHKGERLEAGPNDQWPDLRAEWPPERP